MTLPIPLNAVIVPNVNRCGAQAGAWLHADAHL